MGGAREYVEEEYGKSEIGKGLKNAERNVGNALTNTAYSLTTGDFNNFGRTLYDIASISSSLMFANPDDVTTALGETTIERATREGEAKAAEEKMASEAAKENERLEGIRTAIDQSIMQRLRTPGRSQVSGSLLTGVSASGTLLTRTGK